MYSFHTPSTPLSISPLLLSLFQPASKSSSSALLPFSASTAVSCCHVIFLSQPSLLPFTLSTAQGTTGWMDGWMDIGMKEWRKGQEERKMAENFLQAQSRLLSRFRTPAHSFVSTYVNFMTAVQEQVWRWLCHYIAVMQHLQKQCWHWNQWKELHFHFRRRHTLLP